MKVRHISYRVEFQGRGAGHIHGVLWLDLKEMKIGGVDNSDLQEGYNRLRHNRPLEPEHLEAIENFTDAFVTCTRCVSVAGEEAVQKAEEVNWHGHSKSCTKGGGPVCRWKFPRYPLARTIFVDANREKHDGEHQMEPEKRDDILNRVMGVLVEEEGGKLVLSRKVKEIMISYKNVKETTKEDYQGAGQASSSTFSDNSKEKVLHISQPTFSDISIHSIDTSQPTFSDSSHKSTKQKRSKKRRKESVSKGADVEEPPSKKRKTKTNTITYIKMESPEEYKRNIRKRIEEVLKIASAGRKEAITYWEYEMAVVQQPRKGSEVLLRRDIDEIMINNYNPEWIVTWDANIDVSPVYDYYGTITYITGW